MNNNDSKKAAKITFTVGLLILIFGILFVGIASTIEDEEIASIIVITCFWVIPIGTVVGFIGAIWLERIKNNEFYNKLYHGPPKQNIYQATIFTTIYEVRTCKLCNHENPADNQYCANCGNPLQIKCEICSTINGQDSKYCKYCANDLQHKKPK